ncbi:hypothetical protein ScPMuIL_017828 [Solemya velum]
MVMALCVSNFQRCALQCSKHFLNRVEGKYVQLYKPLTRCHHAVSQQIRQPQFQHTCQCRTFKTRPKLVPEPNNVPRNQNGQSGFLRPLCFTAVVCCGSFTGAMVWQYESMRSHARKIMKSMERKSDEIFQPYYSKQFEFRSHINNMWNTMTPGKKMVATIIASNVAIFFLWKVPSMQRAMMKYFTCLPLQSSPVVSMVLSAFSHYNFWHLAANMYVLWSFSSISLSLFGREQFFAVYMSAAALSALTSSINKLARFRMVASLGASGAIMAILGAVCVSFPDSRLSIAFVSEVFPHSFTADSALKFLLALDTAGVVLGWRIFDHAAHLGGMLFGIWYVKYGRDLIWKNRDVVMKSWHNYRGKP